MKYLTANGGRSAVPWQGIESFSAETIERHIGHSHRITNVESLWNDEEIVVAV